MATVKQLPTPVNVEVVAGDPFTVTFTATSGVTTFASPAVAMTTSGGDAFTTDPGVPTASAASAVLTCAWSAADTAALNTTTRGKTYKYSVEATADGAGPVQFFGGTITVHPVGTAGASTASSTTATVNTGGVAVSATINVGAEGPTGPAGSAGATGADGKTVRSGTGAPSSGLGVDGDFYIDTTADAIYGPKTAGAWGSATSLIGPTGATGPAWPVSEELTTVAATGATETVTVADGTVVDVTLDANCAFTFTNPGSGAGYSFTLIVRQDATGSRTATWPAACRWPGGTDPVLSTAASAIDVLSFFTVDNGTTWFGFFNGKGMAA